KPPGGTSKRRMGRYGGSPGRTVACFLAMNWRTALWTGCSPGYFVCSPASEKSSCVSSNLIPLAVQVAVTFQYRYPITMQTKARGFLAAPFGGVENGDAVSRPSGTPAASPGATVPEPVPLPTPPATPLPVPFPPGAPALEFVVGDPEFGPLLVLPVPAFPA